MSISSLEPKYQPIPKLTQNIDPVLVLSEEVLEHGKLAKSIFEKNSLDLNLLPPEQKPLEYIQRFQPACVIIDVKGQRGSGFEICKNIRSHKASDLISLILVTDQADDDFRYKCYDTKVDNFIETPINLKLLALITKNESKKRKQVRSLELGKERYKDTLNQSPFGVVVIHDNYTIDFANKKILQWLGSEFEPINNQSILELCSYGSRNLLQQKLDKSLGEDTTQVLNARFIKSDKQEISFKITITEIDWRKKELEYQKSIVSDSQVTDNNKNGILLFFEDLSEIESYQRRLLEKNLELDQRNKMQEGIIRSYHHDIRGICTSINSAIKTFLLPQAKEVNTPQFIEDIEGVAENARLLIRTVDDLRDLSKEGRSTNLEEEVQLRNTIEYVKKGFSGDLRSASATVNIPPKFPLVKVIRAEFTQIFSNLISNSLKFRSSYRKLIINITYSHEEGNQLIIKFADNGIGIEVDKLGLIFKGYRVNNSIEGDGIGLSQVQSIIESYGGAVKAESQGIETGLTITMFFNDNIIVKDS